MVFFADADDIMSPDALTTLYDRQQETRADIILGNFARLEEGQITNPILSLPSGTLCKPICNLFISPVWGFLLPAMVIKGNKLRFEEGLGIGEDMLFCCQLAALCRNIAFSNKIVYVYRMHRNSATHTENRVWFAKHHFLVAHHLLCMAALHKDKDAEVFGVLKEKARTIIVNGIAGFQRRFKLLEFAKVKRAYYEEFGDDFRQKVIFGWWFMKAFRANLKMLYSLLLGRVKKFR